MKVENKPLYTRYLGDRSQPNEIYHMTDLRKQHLGLDPKTDSPMSDYHLTEGHYSPGELPEPTDDLEQLRNDMLEFGFCLVKDALSSEQLEVMRTRVDEQAAGERAADLGFFERKDKNGVATNQFVFGLINKGQCFRDVVEMLPEAIAKGPLVEQIMSEVLGANYIINQLCANIAGKGGSPQGLHVGQGMIPKPWPPYPFECNAAILLDDFSARNGGTILVPRSHRILTDAGEGPVPPLPPTVNATAPAGTALIFEGRTVHGAGSNFTDEPRRVLLVAAHRSFLRTQENFNVMLSKEHYENASQKLLQRLGFVGSSFEGTFDGVAAPLHDDYLPVGELTPETGKLARNTPYTWRETKSGGDHLKKLQEMRDSGQALTKYDR